jgi:hypothetical protein
MLLGIMMNSLSGIGNCQTREWDTLGGFDRNYYSRHESLTSFGREYHAVQLSPQEEVNYWEKGPLDRWKFYKGFQASATYDNNLFYGGGEEGPGSEEFPQFAKDDTYFNYSGFVGAGRRGAKTYLEIFYNLSYVDYIENEKLSHFTPGPIRLNTGYKSGRWTVTVTDTFQPYQKSIISANRSRGREASVNNKSLTNVLNVNIGYDISPKTKFDFNYLNSLFYPLDRSKNQDGESGDAGSDDGNVNSDFNDSGYLFQSFTPTFHYQWRPKTSLRAHYTHEIMTFFDEDRLQESSLCGTSDDRSSFEADAVGIGFMSQIKHQTSISGDTGYRWVYYGGSRRDRDGVFIRGTFSTRFSPRMIATFSGEKSSSLTDFYTLRAALSGRISPKVLATLSASWSVREDDNDSENCHLESSSDSAFSDTSNQSETKTQTYTAHVSWLVTPRVTWSGSASYVVTQGDNRDSATLQDPTDPSTLFLDDDGGDNEEYRLETSVQWSPKPYLSFLILYQYLESISDNFDDERFMASARLTVW